ncbi:MAG: hypothetical protein N2485_08600, partial [bacterium]|nr:hypothetical protein [bacterium]
MEKSVQLIIDYLNQLGDKLTPFAKDLFGIYTKQAIADGIGDLIIAIVFFIFIICIGYLTRYGIKKYFDDYLNENEIVSITFWGSILIIALSIISLKFLVDGVKEIVN